VTKTDAHKLKAKIDDGLRWLYPQNNIDIEPRPSCRVILIDTENNRHPERDDLWVVMIGIPFDAPFILSADEET